LQPSRLTSVDLYLRHPPVLPPSRRRACAALVGILYSNEGCGAPAPHRPIPLFCREWNRLFRAAHGRGRARGDAHGSGRATAHHRAPARDTEPRFDEPHRSASTTKGLDLRSAARADPHHHHPRHRMLTLIFARRPSRPVLCAWLSNHACQDEAGYPRSLVFVWPVGKPRTGCSLRIRAPLRCRASIDSRVSFPRPIPGCA